LTNTLWPVHVLTSESEARVLLEKALERLPDLRSDGLTGEGDLLDGHLLAIAICNDFLLGVRPRKSVDDRHTAVDIAGIIQSWGQKITVPHGAVIAAAVGYGFSYRPCGVSAYLNLQWRDVTRRTRCGGLNRP